MNIRENIPLAPLTTFRIGGPGRFFCVVTNEAELVEAVIFARERELPFFVLGGGSNILVGDEGFDGLVIKMGIMGVNIHKKIKNPPSLNLASLGLGTPPFSKGESAAKSPFEKGGVEQSEVGDFTIIAAGAGEIWEDFVSTTVNQGLYGLENLSLIPGTVGAAPVQNIGAYGAEVSKTIILVRALDTETMKFMELTNEQCQFSYRDSVFKNQKGRYIITRVDFNLLKSGEVNIDYKDVREYFGRLVLRGGASLVERPRLAEVRKAIIEIRTSKLPDMKKWGTAGSFFKNPVIPATHFLRLKGKYPDLPGFVQKDGKYKVTLAWILDKICNVKGFAKGKDPTSGRQALVIVTEPGATAKDVYELARELTERVRIATDIEIQMEVEKVGV